MLPNKDQIARARNGRHFALTKGQLLNAVKRLGFKHGVDYRRIDLAMRNADGEETHGQLVAALCPSDTLIVYSFADGFPADKAVLVVQAALRELKVFDDGAGVSTSPRESTSYRAYLADDKQIILTRRECSATLAKYRGDAKFSNAFKPRKVDVVEEVLRRVAVD